MAVIKRITKVLKTSMLANSGTCLFLFGISYIFYIYFTFNSIMTHCEKKARRSKRRFFSPSFLFWCALTGMPVKVTGGDCQEMLKLLPLGVNFADPGMFTGGVACVKRKYYSSKKNHSSSEAFQRSFIPWNGKSVRDFPGYEKTPWWQAFYPCERDNHG